MTAEVTKKPIRVGPRVHRPAPVFEHVLIGRQVCRLGRRHASAGVIRQANPRGEPIYWIGPAGDARDAGEGTDFHATAQGCVSVTPLQVDLSDHASMGRWSALA